MADVANNAGAGAGAAGALLLPPPKQPQQGQEAPDVGSAPRQDQGAAAVAAAAAEPHQRASRPAPPAPRDVCAAWMAAAKEGDVRAMRQMLRQHPGLINQQQPGGLECTALHWAAARDHGDACERLLAWGADARCLTTTGSAPLHSAAAAGAEGAVRSLLFHAPAAALEQLRWANEDGLTPAELALRHGAEHVHGLLLEAQAAAAVDEQRQQGQSARAAGPPQGEQSPALGPSCSPMAAASPPPPPPADALHQRPQGCELRSPAADGTGAVEAAAAAATAVPVDPQLGRAWLDAARRGDADALQRVVAAHAGSPHGLRQLLAYAGAGTSYALIGSTAVHWAAANGHASCLKLLLSQCAAHGVLPAALRNQAEASPMHTAAEHGHGECVRLLGLAGCDMRARDALGQTAAEAAEAAGHSGLAQQLLLLEATAYAGQA